MDWIFLCILALVIYKLTMVYMRHQAFKKNTLDYKEIGAQVLKKRNSRHIEIFKEHPDVIKYGGTIQGLIDGQFLQKFTALDIICTFGYRCMTIGRKLNLSADEMFDSAIELARTRDSELSECFKRGTFAIHLTLNHRRRSLQRVR